MCRDANAVREMMDSFRADMWTWSSISHRVALGGGQFADIEGQELTLEGPMSLSQLGMIEATGGRVTDCLVAMSVKGAQNELWRCLGQGLLAAGAVAATGEFVSVPAAEWAALRLGGNGSYVDYLYFEHNLLKMAYTKIVLPKAEVLALWPSRSANGCAPPIAEGSRPDRARDGRLQATIEALEKLYPDGPPKGLSAKQRFAEINAWHKERGNSKVSFSTILRALERR
jgi:hypothetical protein